MLELLSFEDIYMAYVDEKINEILSEEKHRCEIDGIPIKHHLRCADCGILIGPGHIETKSWNGLCASCARLARRKQGELRCS